MACANNLDQPIEDWTVGGVPITMMCHMERRKVRGDVALDHVLKSSLLAR